MENNGSFLLFAEMYFIEISVTLWPIFIIIPIFMNIYSSFSFFIHIPKLTMLMLTWGVHYEPLKNGQS